MSATKTKPGRPKNPSEVASDIDDYIESLSDERRAGLALAEAAFDLATLVDRVRASGRQDGPDPPDLAELTQQAANHFGRHGTFALVGDLQRYLYELGYRLELNLVDLDTGESFNGITPPSERDG